MFNSNFYPTPDTVAAAMLIGYDVEGKTILEPSAGAGHLVKFLQSYGAHVIACENDKDLRSILEKKCQVIADDFLTLRSEDISHVEYIIMNPPFSADETHIVHAWDIAPAGCVILALCNWQTLRNAYSKSRQRLCSLVSDYGLSSNMGKVFSTAERSTDIEIGFIRLTKPNEDPHMEFDGFFMEEEPEEAQGSGIMQYNAVRDLVNRYVAAMKIYDKQLELALQMNSVTKDFYQIQSKRDSNGKDQPLLTMSVSQNGVAINRNEFKKQMQKSGWEYVFKKLNMEKYATRGLKEDINKFVETQTSVPFTMKNIYVMIQTVIMNWESNMDKAIVEVFQKLTQHHHDNRFNVEGWKTNSHYLMGEKFIMPHMCGTDKWHSGNRVSTVNHGSNAELIIDMVKALCYLSGTDYNDCIDLYQFARYRYKVLTNGKYGNYESLFDKIEDADKYNKKLYEDGKNPSIEDSEMIYGEWFDWNFFQIKAFKKGTMHFKFKDQNLWALFNQRVSKAMGYPLYEHKPSTKPEPKTKPAGTSNHRTNSAPHVKPTVLATFKI